MHIPRQLATRRTRWSLATAVLLLVVGLAAMNLAVRTDSPPTPAWESGVSTTDAPPPVAPVQGPRVAEPGALDRSLPVKVTIASIGVDAPIDPLGLTATGAVAVPKPGPGYDHVGWYDGSPTPGQVGPTVLIGHLDSAANGPSVFWRLGALRVGALVVVTRADGVEVTFEVTRLRRVAKTAFPTADVYADTPDPQLRLITCGGNIDHATGHYRDNVIAFASLRP